MQILNSINANKEVWTIPEMLDYITKSKRKCIYLGYINDTKK